MKALGVLVGLAASALPLPLYAEGVCDVHLGDTVYHLPVTEYSIRAGVSGLPGSCDATNHVGFDFSLALPNLDPVPSQTDSKRELKVSVKYGHHFNSGRDMLDLAFRMRERVKSEILKDPKISAAIKESGFIDPDTYQTLPDGCRKYLGISAVMGNVLQTCNLDDDVLLVPCNTIPPLSLCGVNVNIGDKITLSYSFDYDYFDQALDTHKKLLALIASWTGKGGN